MESKRTEKITIHQALHGYSDGHRLLASSQKLPPATARLIAVLSDLSGSSVIPGFENYLTGYPIPKLDSYALARTWYASEMNRPGCVWTQTLFIEFADLARIVDLGTLLTCFTRPSHQDTRWLDNYGQAITLSVQDGIATMPRADLPSSTSRTLQSLYQFPRKSVVTLIEDASTNEQLALALWSQQWPRLRRSFKFCTGALSLRQVEGKNFDLQFSPLTLANQLQRSIKTENNIIIANPSSPSKSEVEHNKADPVETWVNDALADLHSLTKTKLREFLWRYGTFSRGGRAVFRPLVEILIRVKQIDQALSKHPDQELKAIPDLAGKYFSRREAEPELKVALFSDSDTNLCFWSNSIREENLLTALITTETPSSFDADALAINSRAKRFLRENADHALDLAATLLEQDQSSLSDQFLAGIFEGVDISDALRLSERKPDILVTIIHYQPDLVFHPEIWKSSSSSQQLVFEANIGVIKASEDKLRRFIVALLDAGNDVFAEAIARCTTSEIFVAEVLEWFDQSLRPDPTIFGTNWHHLLASQGRAIFEWLKQQNYNEIQATTLALIAGILDPHDWEVANAGSEIWKRLAHYLEHNREDTNLIKAASFLLALGFKNRSLAGVDFVVSSFEPVYRAAREGWLEYRSWSHLAEQAPSNSYWREWDKCERLSHALMERFIKFDWTEGHLLRITSDYHTFNQIIECGDDTSRGRRFLSNVARRIKEGQLQATDIQIRILKDHKFLY